MRTRDSAFRKNHHPLYGPERFTYLPESNSYRCPAGQQLNYVALNVRNRTHAYIGSRKCSFASGFTFAHFISSAICNPPHSPMPDQPWMQCGGSVLCVFPVNDLLWQCGAELLISERTSNQGGCK